MSRKKLYLLLVFIFALWGGGMVAIKFTFSSFSILQVVFLRVAIAACFYGIIRKRWLPLPYQAGDWKYLCALVLFEPCMLFACETTGLMYTSASQGGVIAACFPICAGVAGWVLLGEKMSPRMIGGMILAVAGVAGASWYGEASAFASNPPLGNLLMGGAVLASTGYAICARHITRRYSFIAVSAIQAIGGTAVFLPFAFAFPMPQSLSLSALLAVLYLGVLVGIVAYLGFNFSLQHLPAGMVALFSSLIPIFTCLFAFLLLGERLTPPQAVFVCLALLGIIFAAIPEKAES